LKAGGGMRRSLRLFLFFSVLSLLVLFVTRLSLYAVEPAKSEQELDFIRLFTDTYQLVKERYVEDVSPRKLLEGAIQGMLSKLDPHSTLFTPDELKEFQVETSGEFGGLGIQITKTENGRLLIVAPIEDTPAYRAGLKAGDIIVKIENKEVTPDMTLLEAVKLMRGKPGTKITIWIWRKGWAEPKPFTIVRAVIKIKSVKFRIIEGNIGYIRFTMFQKSAVEEFKNVLETLKTKKLKGIIVDVRNNPGGLLDTAIAISDYFLPKGKLIVYTKGRIARSFKKYYSSHEPIVPAELPVVMLVNSGTASAAEILTGALRFNNRALVVGEKTFGKGSVQTLYPLEMDYAVKITTAKYYMPNGECIDGKGIKPDVEVALSREDIETLKEEYEEMEEHPERTEEIRKKREERIDAQMRRAIEVIKEFRLIKAMVAKEAGKGA